MVDPEHVLAAAEKAQPDPPRSKLDPYAEALWTLQRKRKRLRAIAAFLHEHGLDVSKSTVARWFKRHPVPRAKAGGEKEHPRRDSRADHFIHADRIRARSFFNYTTEQEP